MDMPEAFSHFQIWVWVKIRYPNNWMVNTKLDIYICGPTSVFHFDPHPYVVFLFGWFHPQLLAPGGPRTPGLKSVSNINGTGPHNPRGW